MIKVTFIIGICFVTAISTTFFVDELSSFEEITDEYINKINAAQNSWKAGHNFPPGSKFSDLKSLSGAIRTPNLPRAEDQEVLGEIPLSFDAREHWPHCKSIRKIKNQGHCGSCWAVSSATTMSDRLCIATKGKFNEDISAQHILSCTNNYFGCHGGEPYDAWKRFIHDGAPTGGDYESRQGCQPYLIEPCVNRTNGQTVQCSSLPYAQAPSCKHTCYNKNYATEYSKDLHFGKDVNIISQNIKQIQANIIKYGPVVTVFDVYCDFYTYKSGVYHPTTSKQCSLHAVRIIGWGTENGVDYWLITNQWGKEWGNKGLVKIRRGKNDCSVEDTIVSGII